MKRSIFVLLAILGLMSVSFAQSGRKIRNPIPGTEASTGTKKEIVTTEAAPVVTEETGYSESAPNAPISISLRTRKSEKDKQVKVAAQSAPTPAAKTETDEDVVKVDTNLISIPITVATRNGSYVPSLSKPNFQVFENGVEQEVAYFGTTDKPFTAILLLDVSGSTSLKIEQIQDGAISFVKQLLPEDKVMVISFDSGVHTLLEYSSDKAALEAAIRKIRFGGGTSLYDAVDESLTRKLRKIEGKKAVVLFTDGVDTTSRRSYQSTVEDAVESEAVIFPIYLNTYLDSIGIGGGGGGPMTAPSALPGSMGGIGGQSGAPSREDYALGRRYLQDLASATGGRIYRPENNSRSLTTAFEAIAEELRSQYEVGYYPTKEGSPGEIKKIKIRINRPNLVIRARDSYVVK
jgi:Ca-activated chloride channel family protein